MCITVVGFNPGVKPPGSRLVPPVHDEGRFVGSLSLADFEDLVTPPVTRPGDREEVSASYRILFELLDNTVFDSLDRQQLLGASREIEDRAFRVGHGTLRACFHTVGYNFVQIFGTTGCRNSSGDYSRQYQSLSNFRDQAEVYHYLAAETDLDVHVYGKADWEPPEVTGITYHRSGRFPIERFWALAFDGGSDGTQACGLVARRRDEADGYAGFWTYDPEVVGTIATELASVGE